MDPNDINLDNLSKSFEYTKLAGEIDSCRDIEQIKNIAKCFCKLLDRLSKLILFGSID